MFSLATQFWVCQFQIFFNGLKIFNGTLDNNVLLDTCMLSCFSHVQLFETPWTIACQALLFMGILWARLVESVALPSFRGSYWPKDQTSISYLSALAGRFSTTSATWEALRIQSVTGEKWLWIKENYFWGHRVGKRGKKLLWTREKRSFPS